MSPMSLSPESNGSTAFFPQRFFLIRGILIVPPHSRFLLFICVMLINTKSEERKGCVHLTRSPLVYVKFTISGGNILSVKYLIYMSSLEKGMNS